MFRIFKQLGNGEWECIASCSEFEKALQLVEALRAEWPGEYAVRDWAGNGTEGNRVNCGTLMNLWNDSPIRAASNATASRTQPDAKPASSRQACLRQAILPEVGKLRRAKEAH
jgi:hypothetical protein